MVKRRTLIRATLFNEYLFSYTIKKKARNMLIRTRKSIKIRGINGPKHPPGLQDIQIPKT